VSGRKGEGLGRKNLTDGKVNRGGQRTPGGSGGVYQRKAKAILKSESRQRVAPVGGRQPIGFSGERGGKGGQGASWELKEEPKGSRRTTGRISNVKKACGRTSRMKIEGGVGQHKKGA